MRLVEHLDGAPPELVRPALVRDGKRRTVMPFTCSTPAGSSFFQVT
jgi:hypothetical protein